MVPQLRLIIVGELAIQEPDSPIAIEAEYEVLLSEGTADVQLVQICEGATLSRTKVMDELAVPMPTAFLGHTLKVCDPLDNQAV